MGIVSFQYLKNGFNREFGDEIKYLEDNAFIPPNKPYFKGNNKIPDNHPSKIIRSLIADELDKKEEINIWAALGSCLNYFSVQSKVTRGTSSYD